MIEIGVMGVFWGSLFQDHKWRVSEWCSWHPAFKYIGLWAGYEAEYIDILLFLIVLIAQCDLYIRCWYFSYLVIFPYLLIIPLLLLHIYNEHVRWGWCAFHSALVQYWQRSWDKFKDPALQFVVWLDNTSNSHKSYDFIPVPNCLYYFVGAAVMTTAQKTHFLEVSLTLESWPMWYKFAIADGCCLLVLQPILWANARPDQPSVQDLRPAHRIFQNHLLHSRHFLRWNFFYWDDMPWRFFHIMNLPGVIDPCPYTSHWRVTYPDVGVLWVYKDSYKQNLFAALSDIWIFPYIKATTQKGTYRTKTGYSNVYNTSD
jgi:hypothetical protein